MLFKELGDAYQIQKQYDLSINYYNKALHLSQTYENHKNYVPLIYDELTKVYTETGDCEKARITSYNVCYTKLLRVALLPRK